MFVHHSNSAMVAVKMHSAIATTVATVTESATSCFFCVGVILVVNADLFKLSHSRFLLPGNK